MKRGTEKHGLPETFGRFDVRSRVGAGAFGAVFRAYDSILNREVALKVPHPGTLASERAKARFLREPKAAARLRHPHIVPVFDAGEEGAHHYIASAFVAGNTLQAELEKDRVDFQRSAEIVRCLAEALHYAHRQGVVHRDVKPANVMLDEDGSPMLMDFGLAQVAETAEDLTHDGTPLGTPAYMSPEQAAGHSDKVGPAADQYSLGVVLYELLCGEVPFSGPPALVISLAIHEIPPALREKRPAVPRDLETICLKAISKRPESRYADCREMGEDLRRWQAGEPITARPMGPLERFGRWCRRNPAPAALTVALFSILLTGAIVSSLFARWAVAQKNRIVQERLALDREQAESLVAAALDAPARAVPYAVANLEAVGEQAVPLLHESLANEAASTTSKMHALFALAHLGERYFALLVDFIADTPTDETPNLITALKPARGAADKSLRERAEQAESAGDWRTKSRLAIVALHLGNTSIARDMCRLRPVPVQRTIFIETFNDWGPPVDFADYVENASDPALRSGICLGVGGIPAANLPPDTKQAWQRVFAHWYQHAPDTGTHSAAGWALRQWNVPEPNIAPGTEPSDGRDWYVNSVGMTMLRIPAGHLVCPDEDGNERTVTVEQPFLISDREVTLGQYQHFMADKGYSAGEQPKFWESTTDEAPPTPDHPVRNIRWYDVARFCDWLNTKEERETCFRRLSVIIKHEGTFGRSSSEQKTVWRPIQGACGYRLPTDVEWEYACRAGTTTDYACGDDETVLLRYAVCRYSNRRPGQPRICGNALCNGWGLFDMHGNVTEWCLDYSRAPNSDPDNADARVWGAQLCRGGAFNDLAEYCRSPQRFGDYASEGSLGRGFRVVFGSIAKDFDGAVPRLGAVPGTVVEQPNDKAGGVFKGRIPNAN